MQQKPHGLHETHFSQIDHSVVRPLRLDELTKVGSWSVPPLRKRREDIPILVEYFVKRLAERMQSIRRIEKRTLELCERYPWPGKATTPFRSDEAVL